MKKDEIKRYPIEDSIDLHTFRPQEVKNLLDDYLQAASRKGFTEVRIIHGKGVGVLRRIVRSILESHPLVVSFEEAGPQSGGWGATIARIRAGGLKKKK
ncbi:MAG: Smr/MutS family protein [Syntrophobacteraceae bacterium]|nr:Smr/MutS family protein [Syntrophobacteraceae bacterium]